MSKGFALGLKDAVGPYTSVSNIYDAKRWADRSSFVNTNSGTREGTIQNQQLGQRYSVYERTPGKLQDKNYTNMAETVEQQMGNCRPGIQDLSPAYGPPTAPNIYTSYPVKSVFENRRKWNDNFDSPLPQQTRQPQPSPSQPVPNDRPTPGGDLRSHHPVPTKQQPILLGSNLISSGEDQYAHRMTYLNRWFNEDDGEILISTPKSMQSKYMGSYSDELFKTPIDNTENKISTGIMMNPYTGEMLETFENQMPPPNTDKSVLSDRFEMVNPKLLQMQGNYNNHAPKPIKKEVCLDVPGTDFGNNVWGDQLYEEERRKRMFELIHRDIWNNRDGDSATTTAVAKEKPAGFVGVQQMYRALPYLPPVNILDDHGYIPVSSYTAPEATVIKAEVSVRKPDLTTCTYLQPAGPLNDQEVEYVVGQYENRPTWRGGGDTYYAGSAFLENNGTAGPQQTQNKSTLKEFMEQAFEPIVTQNQVIDTGGAGYVVTQTANKSTMKEFMEQSFAPTSTLNQVAETGGAGYVVTQTVNKSTMKEFMEQSFAPTSTLNQVAESGGAGYVVTQTVNKPTLKEFMESEFPVNVVDPNKPESGYTIQQTENRATLKQLMQQAFDVGNFADQNTGSYIEFQGPLEEVRRAYYEVLPAVGRPAHFSEGVGGDYVGNGLITSRQNRGQVATNWVEPSRVPQDAGDTNSRWIGEYDRDTKRELVPNTPASDLSTYQATAARMIGSLTARCNTDLHETDDEWLWTHGFAPQTQDVIVG